MLHLLDQALETFLRASLPPELADLDVAFDAPDGEWSATLTRPTVNLFLRDVRRNLAERNAGRALRTGGDGRAVWTVPPPRADCRYLVTAWTAEVDDEHRILGEVLAVLLRTTELTGEHLPEALADVLPRPSLSLAASGDDDQADFWSALGGQLKPGLDVTVTTTIDALAGVDAGRPVEQYVVGVVDGSGRSSSRRVVGGRAARATAGATVTSPRGGGTVGDDGAFAVAAEPGDDVVVDADPPARGTVPDAGVVRPRRHA
ncbi:MAG: DUF4255 domain-containing protein [Actinobacteria bacterium]|nr:DUF4255 domain-containing protein [Actinomycetota bacterium]